MIQARSAFVVVGALGAGSALLFARTLVLATLIPAEDFARAAVLAVMMSVVDLFVVTGAQARVFQHPDAGAEKTLNGLHGLQALRGLFGALGILVLAWPMASLVAMPDLTAGFAAMAVLSPILGVAHLGAYQRMREGRHGANAWLTVIPAVLSFLAIWPLAQWLGDWRAFLGVQFVHATAFSITSHLVIRTPYRPQLSADIGRDLRFYLPLLAAGALLLVAMQGDRVLVARAFPEFTLAGFALALTLTVPLVQIATRVLGNLLQPQLSQLRGDAFVRGTLTALDLHCLAAVALVIGACLLGPVLIALLFNSGLQLAATVIGAVAAVQALRLMRAGLTAALMARGDSMAHLLCNLPRVASVAVAAGALTQGASLIVLLWIAALGEFVGLLVAQWRIRAIVPLPVLLRRGAWGLPLCLVALIWPPHHAAVLGAVLATPILAFVCCPGLRAVADRLRRTPRPLAVRAKPL